MFVTALHRRKLHKIIRDGLVGWWPLDEGSGSTAGDASGQGNDGTLQNMESEDWVSGWNGAGSALDLDGVDEYISLPHGAYINSSGFTLIARVKADAVTGTYRQILTHDYYGAGTVERNYQLRLDTSGYLSFIRFNSSNGVIENIVADTLITTSWMLVTTRFDAINGSELFYGTTSVGTSSNTTANNTTAALSGPTIGAGETDAYGAQYEFAGLIDDVRIYNRALSTGEISTIAAGLG